MEVVHGVHGSCAWDFMGFANTRTTSAYLARCVVLSSIMSLACFCTGQAKEAKHCLYGASLARVNACPDSTCKLPTTPLKLWQTRQSGRELQARPWAAQIFVCRIALQAQSPRGVTCRAPIAHQPRGANFGALLYFWDVCKERWQTVRRRQTCGRGFVVHGGFAMRAAPVHA